MKRVIIIGSGFAGLACAGRLSSKARKLGLEVGLISDKDVTTFLPMLPDCLGRGIAPAALTYSVERLSRRSGFKFIRDKVIRLDPENKRVITAGAIFSYDYLVVASGSETNFYGNDRIKESAFKLDDAADAALIQEALKENEYDSYLVAGGGYTGVEVATNLSLFLKKKKLNRPVIIVERAGQILGPLPVWMKDYVLANLKKLKIEVLTDTSVSSVDNSRVTLSNGKVLENSLLIWTAGVKTADFIQNLSLPKNPQGRLKVDKCLNFYDSCFAAGDAGVFDLNGDSLRMAVQFSIMQGDCIARNIILALWGRTLSEYKPVDLGYIIPMANNRSCGRVLGADWRGFLPTLMHYFMCVFRSYGFKNRLRIIASLISKGG